MNRNWEAVFKTWSKGPSDSEEQRISNTLKQIREAINKHDSLRNRDIKVIVQGSYKSRVNVRNESDIDTGVICYDTFYPDYSDDNVKTLLENKFSDSSYAYQTFKNEIEEALVSYFGRSSVKRGNKAFDIKANTYRVEADVAVFFEHRRYYSQSSYHSGVQLLPDNGNPKKVINWPEQHYDNGVEKNDKTNRRYKRTVRILKKLSIEMEENNIASAKNIPGFLIECLVWNAPNYCFNNYDSYVDIVRSVLAHLFNNTITRDKCLDWGEVSELKYLFRGSQSWTIEGTHAFIKSAWSYLEFE